MPRITEAARQLRRDDIAAAARRCFVRGGYAATSMADIIAEAGSSAGGVYSHFESKAELLRFVATTVLKDRLGGLRRALQAREGGLTPALVAEVLMGEAPDPQDASLLVQMWSQAPSDPELLEVTALTVRALRKTVRKALLPWAEARFADDPKEHAGDAADAVIAAIHGYVVRCVLTPQEDLGEVQRRIVAGLGVMSD